MAVQSAAVDTVSPGGSFTVGALGFSDDDDRGAVAGLVLVRAPRLPPASSRRAPPGRTHIPTRTSRKTRTRASGPRARARAPERGEAPNPSERRRSHGSNRTYTTPRQPSHPARHRGATMTITTGTIRTGRLADRGRTMHVLLDDDQGRLRLRRLRPWHPMLACFLAARLDRELADGTSPEASASL